MQDESVSSGRETAERRAAFLLGRLKPGSEEWKRKLHERKGQLRRLFDATFAACREGRHPFGFELRVPPEKLDLEMIEIRLRSLCKPSNVNLCERRFRKDLEKVKANPEPYIASDGELRDRPRALTIEWSDAVRLAVSTFRRGFMDVMAQGGCVVDPVFGHWSEVLTAECRETIEPVRNYVMSYGGQLEIHESGLRCIGPSKLTKAAAFKATLDAIIEWQDRVIDQALVELRGIAAE